MIGRPKLLGSLGILPVACAPHEEHRLPREAGLIFALSTPGGLLIARWLTLKIVIDRHISIPTVSALTTVHKMADVDMADAPPSGAVVKKKSGVAGESSKALDDKKRFEVKKWNAVALWAWDIVVDNCAICRNHIMDLCKSCHSRSHFQPPNCNCLLTASLSP